MLRREAKIICLVIERRNSDFWGIVKIHTVFPFMFGLCRVSCLGVN